MLYSLKIGQFSQRTHVKIIFIAAWLLTKPALCFAQEENAEKSRIGIVTDAKAFIWGTPGYTWKDCRPEDGNAHYLDDNDKDLTWTRFKSGGSEACKQRNLEMHDGDMVEIVTDANDQPVTVAKQVNVGGELVEKNFYEVRYKGKDNLDHLGWIAEHQMRILAKTEKAALDKKPPIVEDTETEKPPCPPIQAKTGDGAKSADQQITPLKNAFVGKTNIPKLKSPNEINQFACLHRDGNIKKPEFDKLIARFSKAAHAAETSFHVPYGLTMCFMLVESALKHDGYCKNEYCGYGQFGSALVSDLKDKISDDSDYREMWKQYSAKVPGARFTDSAIRTNSNPESVTGAVAVALKSIYEDRVAPLSQCKNCSHSPTLEYEKLTRKDLFLIIAGYNFSPFQVKALSKRPLDRLMKEIPPPEITHNYMNRVENCLRDQQFEKFHTNKIEPIVIKRAQQCAQL